MADEIKQEIMLQTHFYRAHFMKFVGVIAVVFMSIALTMMMLFYLYLNKPRPEVFLVGKEFRILKPVGIDQPYLSRADLLQWVVDAIPAALTYDFLNYDSQIKTNARYFTSDGWKIFLNHLNIYANYNNVQAYKLFITGAPAAAPVILKQGLLSGRYAWWIQLPVTVTYAGYRPPPTQSLTLQVLIVRVPTENNLTGVGIENVILAAQT